MKVGNMPLVHLGRLRKAAEEVQCFGLLSCINEFSRTFLEGRKQERSGLDTPPSIISIHPPEDPATEAAWDKLVYIIAEKYAAQEELLEQNADEDDDDDCTSIPRFLIYVAETLPTLSEDIRRPVDKFLGEIVRPMKYAS